MSADQPTLLVVEDQASTRMLVQGMLGKQGYRVVQAEHGASGVAAFELERPDVVLLDVVMPVMDGFEACRRMRTLDRDDGTPIIMLTGADDFEAIEKAFEAGATDFITKPINWPLLTQRLRYALRSGALLREVRQNRLREAAAQRIAKLGFWTWEPASDRFSCSDDVPELLQMPHMPREGMVSEVMSGIHPDDRERVRRAFDAVVNGGRRVDLEIRLLSPAGEQIIRMIGERGNEGRDLERVYGAIQNITDTRRTEALVDYLALHDELTGLGNRRLFSQAIRRALDEARGGSNEALTVAWIDLARFHRHNDEFGEAAGNALLAQVAQRLQMLNVHGEVARVGGDEFAVLVRGKDSAEAMHRLEQVFSGLDHPFKVLEQETFISYTAGMACFPEHAADPETLLTLAQEAQRQARQLGRQYMSVGEIGNTYRSSTLDIERALRRALEHHEFHLVYQPQMELRSGRIVGAEALLRWKHPERGLVPPVEFIPILEESGQISAVGAWVLAEASRQAYEWARQGMGIRVGINLSARQFHDPGLLDTIVNASTAAGVDPQLIELEITESLAMQDPDHAITRLEYLQRLGYKIAIDDFGIGYSSLEYLLRFPLNSIKIDRAFVMRITDSQADRAIVRAITAIAQTLGLTTIAEGIENQRQCDFLEALGVSEVQGFLIGRPMSPDQLVHLLRNFVRPGLAQDAL